jgi:hypothetical protein
VGMGKALSTYLQDAIFPYIKNIYYSRGKYDFINFLSKKIIDGNPLNIDMETEKENLETFIRTIKEQRILISEEWFDGHIEPDYRDKQIVIDLLKEFYPKAKIFLIIRRQDTFLESYYRQMIYFGYSMSFKSFINYKKGEFCHYRIRSTVNVDVRSLNYFNVINYYMKKFGKDNVVVLPFELFLENKQKFLSIMYDRLKLDPYYPDQYDPINRSHSLLSIYLRIVLNRLLIRPFNSLGFIPERPFHEVLRHKRTRNDNLAIRLALSLSYRCSLEWMLRSLEKVIYIKGSLLRNGIGDKIIDYHRNSNIKLSEVIGFELGRYGYY